MSNHEARSFFFVAFSDYYPSASTDHTTVHGRLGFVASFAAAADAIDSGLCE